MKRKWIVSIDLVIHLHQIYIIIISFFNEMKILPQFSSEVLFLFPYM